MTVFIMFSFSLPPVSELSFQEGSVYNSELETANYEHNEESDVEQKVKAHIIEQDMQNQIGRAHV